MMEPRSVVGMMPGPAEDAGSEVGIEGWLKVAGWLGVVFGVWEDRTGRVEGARAGCT